MSKIDLLKKLTKEEVINDAKIALNENGAKALKFLAYSVDHNTVGMFAGLVAAGFAGKSAAKKIVVGAATAQIVKTALIQAKDNKDTK